MKKAGSLLVLSLMITTFLVGVVSAGPVQDINKLVEGIVEVGEPLFKDLLGATPSGEWLFAKVLLAVLFFTIVWVALKKVPFFGEHNWVLITLSVVVSLLGIRWINTEGLIKTIILPYSALGVALTAGLPFVLFFLVINVGFKNVPGTSYNAVRRVAWILFAVVFIGLWFSRYDDIKGATLYIYPVTAILAFVMAVFDGTIRRFLINLEMEKVGATNVREATIELRRRINQANDDLARGVITAAERDQLVRDFHKRISALHR